MRQLATMWMRMGRATDEDAVERPARLGIGGFFLFLFYELSGCAVV
jgi:hypothetical protein